MGSLYAIYLTEADAKGKWCPLARSPDFSKEAAVVANREPSGKADPGTFCIASGCMAWRKHGQIGLTPEGKKVDRDLDGRTRWTDVGYCGAFGHPDPVGS